MKSKIPNPKSNRERLLHSSLAEAWALWIVLLVGLLTLGSGNSSLARTFPASRTESAERELFPPPRVRTVPAFHVPPEMSSLDEGWVYVQTLIDADTSRPDLYNAYPVGIDFSHSGRGMLALLHTVFATTNGGRSWYNLDLNPPPAQSTFNSLRAPTFINSLAWRVVERDSVFYDSFYVSTIETNADTGSVRLFWYLGGTWRLNVLTQFYNTDWLTHLVIYDSMRAVALAGIDGHIYDTDSLSPTRNWDTLDYDFSPSFLNGEAGWAGPFTMAVGSAQWISRDYGNTWEIQPAADPLGDYGASFCDSLHGAVGGGRTSPRTGWVRITTDGGLSWSPRRLTATYPIRAVLCVNPQLAYAAGGSYEDGVGGIWKSTDGGLNWVEEITTTAEIRALAWTRSNGAYIDIFAAGCYPDFRGGVWQQRIFMPDTTRPFVVYADPDTLDFGTIPVSGNDTLVTYLKNIGAETATLLTSYGSDMVFTSPDSTLGVELSPGDSLRLRIVCAPDSVQVRTELFAVGVNGESPVPIICKVDAVLSAGNRTSPIVPHGLSLSIFPNPANAEFTLKYSLPRDGDASLKLYDVTGRLSDVHSLGQVAAGEHTYAFSAQHLPSGIYFVTLQASGEMVTHKLLLLK